MHRSMSTVTVKLLSLVIMLAPLVAGLPVQAQTPIALGRNSAAVRTDPRLKIHPNLLNEIDGPGASPERRAARQIEFVARIVAGTDLGAYAANWFARPFVDPAGTTVAYGVASPAGVWKMAALDRVLYLQRPESLIEPPTPPDPDVQSSLNNQAKFRISADAAPTPEPTGWYDITRAIHGSLQAWNKGYTGKDVRLMINDSGADYCHPDLHGTWAYIDDPKSPYYGLPQMFDSTSSFIAAQDFNNGSSLIAAGLADYADTSTKVRGSSASYQPLGASAAHTYTLPRNSKSGVYHIGAHPDNSLAALAPTLSTEFGDGSAVAGERAAVLVVDADTAGVYNRVYVDLNYNFDFTDDKPARLDRTFNHRETACLDYNGDGLNDISGGLVYFVSDGDTPVPTLNWYWGVPGSFFGNGDLVAFHVQDFVASPAGNHGQGCTSVAVGQGRVRGSVNFGPDGPPQAAGKGLVTGPGKDVQTTQNGDFYTSPFSEDGFIFASLGYDGAPLTGDDIQITSNSWGSSEVDNEGWDGFSRLVDLINRELGPRTSFLISGGNGAAGYGTITEPAPPSGIKVAASTLYDEIGTFEPIASEKQIVGGDPMSWSARGPGATADHGPDVLASGAFGVGDLSLNEVGDGAIATESFGGTSMASPVAAGNLALMYQAWKARTGAWPTFDDAKAVLMGTSRDTKHDVFTQGAGLVNADEGTDVAAGRSGAYATPPAWRVGHYRGQEHEAFANIISPGQADTQTFTLWNHSNAPLTVKLDARRFKLLGTKDYSFTSLNQSRDHGQFTIPDYVVRIDQDIPPATDLLQVLQSYAYEQFNPTGELDLPTTAYNNWSIHLLNWTDLEDDNRFWQDQNGNRKVDVSLDSNGNLVGSEMDSQEFVRFSYGYNTGPAQEVRVGRPLQRMADGILLSFRHRAKVAAVPTTDLRVQASFWDQTTWEWLSIQRSQLTIPAGGQASFNATMSVPREAAYGMYEGSIMATYQGHKGTEEIVIPVTVPVAARGTSFAFGAGNQPPQERLLYDNAAVYGYTDYGWRAEAGDWRFFYTDIRNSDVATSGTPYLLVDNRWNGDQTDIDTIVLGPTKDCFSNGVNCPFPFTQFAGLQALYGPYTLEPIGGSPNTYVGSGRWAYDTSSGGPRELIAAPLDRPGLHGILLHQVRVDGEALREPFGGQVGLATLGQLDVAAGADSGSLTIHSQIALDDFAAAGFGLSRPITTTETAQQDDPNDPFSASIVRTVELNHAAELTVSTSSDTGALDIDLYLLDPDGNLVAASTTPEAEETVTLVLPEDGTYTILVHGWSVPGGNAPFELTIDAVQGNDVSMSDVPDSIPAGGSATLGVRWDTSGLAAGTYTGMLVMGPSYAPALFRVPILVTVP